MVVNSARSTMFRSAFSVALMICLSAVGNIGAQAQVSPVLFDLQMNKEIVLGEPWPIAPVNSIRLWDSATAWSVINPAPGQYNWTIFDLWLSQAQQHGATVLYAFGRTPPWASSNPNDPTCAVGAVGECHPPIDLNPDGTGPNKYFKDFVTAVATRAGTRIQYWETWNEASNPGRWQGTIAQMIRIASDERTIIKGINPSAVILSPSTGVFGSGLNWVNNYLAAGGGQYADGIGVHAYVHHNGNPPVAEDLIGFMSAFKSTLTTYQQNTKPIWDTESSWGVQANTHFTDLNLQAGFVGRFFLMHYLTGIRRLYWYQWNNDTAGTLWLRDPNNISAPGTLLPPGMAYKVIQQWLVGRTVTNPCTVQGSVWTCNVTGSSGFHALMVWDTAQTCTPCTFSTYAVPTGYTQYLTLAGQTVAISGSSVNIGYIPILLEP